MKQTNIICTRIQEPQQNEILNNRLSFVLVSYSFLIFFNLVFSASLILCSEMNDAISEI